MPRDQWLRASQSIALNIAEGNAKAGQPDRRRYFEIARGSAVECAAIQDVLRVSDVLDETEHEIQKNHLDRISAMLTRLGGRGYLVQEDGLPSNRERIDSDTDSDSENAIPGRGDTGRAWLRLGSGRKAPTPPYHPWSNVDHTGSRPRARSLSGSLSGSLSKHHGFEARSRNALFRPNLIHVGQAWRTGLSSFRKMGKQLGMDR